MTDTSIGQQIGNELIAIVEDAKRYIGETYATIEYVDQTIGVGIATRVVEELPDIEEAESGVLYLVPVSSNLKKDKNKYKEYIVVDGAWEDLGSTELDLTQYPNKNTVDELLATKLSYNDPRIPTKLSDLQQDVDSPYMLLEVVNELPALSNAVTNKVYLVKNEDKATYNNGNVDEILYPSDMYGSSIVIKNNGTSCGFYTKVSLHNETKITTIASNGTYTYNLPENIEQIRFSSNNNVNVEITWNRNVHNNYVKYVKVIRNNTPAWEIIGNPNGVTYAYLHNNYVKKGEVQYTRQDVCDAVDGAITILEAGVPIENMILTITSNNSYLTSINLNGEYVEGSGAGTWIYTFPQNELVAYAFEFNFGTTLYGNISVDSNTTATISSGYSPTVTLSYN